MNTAHQPTQYPSLESLLKHLAGTRSFESAAAGLRFKLAERHPDYTAVAAFKVGPRSLDSALLLPVGPSCPLKSLEQAQTAILNNGRTLVGYWIKP